MRLGDILKFLEGRRYHTTCQLAMLVRQQDSLQNSFNNSLKMSSSGSLRKSAPNFHAENKICGKGTHSVYIKKQNMKKKKHYQVRYIN